MHLIQREHLRRKSTSEMQPNTMNFVSYRHLVVKSCHDNGTTNSAAVQMLYCVCFNHTNSHHTSSRVNHIISSFICCMPNKICHTIINKCWRSFSFEAYFSPFLWNSSHTFRISGCVGFPVVCNVLKALSSKHVWVNGTAVKVVYQCTASGPEAL